MEALREKVREIGLDPGRLGETALVFALDAYDKGEAAGNGAGTDLLSLDPMDSLAQEAKLAERLADAYKAGEVAGHAAGKTEAKAELVAEFEALQSVDINEGATRPATFEQAVKAMGYPEARRRFPDLFNRHERNRRRRRRRPTLYPSAPEVVEAPADAAPASDK